MLALCAVLAPAGAAHSFPVLEEPAPVTRKSLQAATFDVARAGARLVAVGERGTILLSDDAGSSWRQVSVPVSVTLTAVQFVDDRTGWTVGHLGVVLHSTDGGETWTRQLDGEKAAGLVLQAAEARARAEGRDPEDDRAVASARRLVEDGPDKPFFDLHFEDEKSGFIIGAFNLVFRTQDGGRTWEPWDHRVQNRFGYHLYGIGRAGDALFIAGEQGTLLRSTDGGENFESLESPYEGSFFGLVASPKGEVVVYGLRGHVYQSADGGETWNEIETGLPLSITSGIELTDGTFALTGQTGDLLLSRDRGRSFLHTPATAPLLVCGITEAPDASLVLAGMRGPMKLAQELR